MLFCKTGCFCREEKRSLGTLNLSASAYLKLLIYQHVFMVVIEDINTLQSRCSKTCNYGCSYFERCILVDSIGGTVHTNTRGWILSSLLEMTPTPCMTQ